MTKIVRAVNVRSATRADRDGFVRLAADGSGRVGVIDRAIESGECLVATDAEDPRIGYGVLEYSFFQQGLVALVYVAAANRCQGIGTAWQCLASPESETLKLNLCRETGPDRVTVDWAAAPLDAID